MTTGAVMALEEDQFMLLTFYVQSKTPQRNLAKGRLHTHVVGSNQFPADLSNSLGEVHADEACSTNHAESHGQRTPC